MCSCRVVVRLNDRVGQSVVRLTTTASHCSQPSCRISASLSLLWRHAVSFSSRLRRRLASCKPWVFQTIMLGEALLLFLPNFMFPFPSFLLSKWKSTYLLLAKQCTMWSCVVCLCNAAFVLSYINKLIDWLISFHSPPYSLFLLHCLRPFSFHTPSPLFFRPFQCRRILSERMRVRVPTQPDLQMPFCEWNCPNLFLPTSNRYCNLHLVLY